VDALDRIRQQFAELGNKADDEIDLAGAALLVAKLAYPKMAEAEYVERLDEMGGRLRRRIRNETAPVKKLGELNRLLFEEEKFRGNTENFYDPDNSFLNRVLDRKTGLPITLSLVQMEVGKRAGMNIRGIGMPGHFITAYYYGPGRIFTDAFNRGEILTEQECEQRIAERVGPGVENAEWFLRPVTSREFLVRMLRNLKGIAAHIGDDLLAFQLIHWILTLLPDSPDELRERGYLYEIMGNADMATADLVHYLEIFPDAPDADEIVEKINALKVQPTQMH
jgi:regulator of sirC expression with transglutaminase-like and TPR domain